MLNEMTIRKQLEFSGDIIHGDVDIGTGLVDDSLPEAKFTMVLMAVAINESWKIPVE